MNKRQRKKHIRKSELYRAMKFFKINFKDMEFQAKPFVPILNEAQMRAYKHLIISEESIVSVSMDEGVVVYKNDTLD